ncbi:MAG TPA: 5'-nucleotidase [Bacteroidia bacterium]|nr:5'-nucleotidase [Bacteroidia bacterium]
MLRYRNLILCALGFSLVAGCSSKISIQKTETEAYAFSKDGNAAADSLVEKRIQPYREKMAGEMKIILAESLQPLEKSTPESRLGNFVSDACLLQCNQRYQSPDGKPADLIILNNGGLRKGLPKGTITKGDVYELMPFENELVVLTMTGDIVKKIFNFIASKDGAPVSGVRFQIQDRQAVNITIQGNPFDSTKTYKVVTSDYLANGGDQFSLFAEATQREQTGIKVRDAIMQYLYIQGKTEEKISVNPDGRISYVK